LKLDEKINEKILKLYVAYELDRNFAEIIIQSNGLWILIDISKEDVDDPENKLIDASEKGHWATGNFKIRVEKMDDIKYCMDIIEQSYKNKL